MVIFQQGESNTMIVRLCTAISGFDKEWTAKCLSAEERKIQKLAEIVKKHHWNSRMRTCVICGRWGRAMTGWPQISF